MTNNRTFTFKRHYDGSTITPDTIVQFSSDLFNVSYVNVSGAQKLGQTVHLAKDIDAKTFSITFKSGDMTRSGSNKLRTIQKFFRDLKDGENIWFSFSDTQWGLTDVQFKVEDASFTNFSTLVVECEARWGDFITETILSTPVNQNRTSGQASTAYSGAYANSSSLPATIRLTITPATHLPSQWKAGTVISFSHANRVVRIVLGKSNGSSLQHYLNGPLVIESSAKGGIVRGMGNGVLDASVSQLFDIAPGETGTLVVDSMAYPFVTANQGYNFKVEILTRSQA